MATATSRTVAVSFGPFKSEVYIKDHVPSVYWVLRWLIDFLGSNSAKNFIGMSVGVWRNRVAEFVPVDADGNNQEVEHILNSSWSVLQREKQNVEKSELNCEDFSASTFAFLVLVSTWASKGPRAGSKWNLAPDDFKGKAQQCLRLFQEFLFMGSHEKRTEEFILAIKQGGLDVQQLRQTELGRLVAKAFAEPTLQVPLDKVLVALFLAESNKNFSWKRRTATNQCISDLLMFMSDSVDARKDDAAIWEATGLHQLQQLRTCRGVVSDCCTPRPSPVRKSLKN